MLIGGLSFAFITPVLNTPDEQVHLSRTIHIVEGNVNMGNKNIHITEDYFDVYKNFKNHLPNLLYLKKGRRPNKGEVWERNGLQGNQLILVFGYIPQALGFGIGKF